MADRIVRLITKRTSVPGKIPTGTTGTELNFIKSGELASNLIDRKLYSFDGSEVFEYGTNSFLGLTGGTISGNTLVIGNLSASTIYSGSTNLSDIFITPNDLTYTTVSDGSNIIVEQIGNDYKVSVSGSPIFNQLTTTGLTTVNSNFIVTGNTNLEATSASTLYTESYLQFNTGYTGNTIVEGRMYWDEPNGSVSLGMHGSQVSQQIGLEYYYYIKNQSGATIENGRVVRASGTLGSSGRILGEYMIADGTIPVKYTLGIATEDIVDGDDGYVTEFGLVSGINTTGSPYGETWVDGDILWVSPTIPGGLTNIEPSYPNFKIEMAIVINANANGSIFVRPHRYPSTNEIQDIISSGKTDNSILQYNNSLSAYTNTTTPTLTSVSATTISGGTILSGSTNLYSIFSTTDTNDITRVQPGANIVTGGTANNPIINLASSPSINNLTFSGTASGGNVFGVNISGGTIYSGSTDLRDIFLTSGDLSGTSVSAGSNINVQQTGSDYKVSVDSSPSLNNISFSGTVSGGNGVFTSSNSTSLSGGTIFSGSTNLYSIFVPTGSAGEVNTASSVGGGNSIFKQKSGVDLQFRSLSAGTNIEISTGDTITINSTASGGSSRITGSTTTTNTTPTVIATIDALKDNATNLIEIYVKAYQASATQYGIWKRVLSVTRVSGTPIIRFIDSVSTSTSSGLRANSVSFEVSGGNITISVTGIAATTISWESAYEIVL